MDNNDLKELLDVAIKRLDRVAEEFGLHLETVFKGNNLKKAEKKFRVFVYDQSKFLYECPEDYADESVGYALHYGVVAADYESCGELKDYLKTDFEGSLIMNESAGEVEGDEKFFNLIQRSYYAICFFFVKLYNEDRKALEVFRQVMAWKLFKMGIALYNNQSAKVHVVTVKAKVV